MSLLLSDVSIEDGDALSEYIVAAGRHASSGTSLRSLTVSALALSIAPIVATAANLRYCSVPARADYLQTLGELAGHKLVELCTRGQSTDAKLSAASFFAFTALESLSLGGHITMWSPLASDVTPPSTALARLRALDFWADHRLVLPDLARFK